MPIRYRIDLKQEIVYTTADGVLTDAELAENQDNLRKDPDFHPSFNRLADYRAVESFELTGTDVRRLAGAKGITKSEGSRRAFVVSSDLAYGMARMFQILADDTPVTIEVFKDMTEARKWLGLE